VELGTEVLVHERLYDSEPSRAQNNVQGASDAGCLPTYFTGYQSLNDSRLVTKHQSLASRPLPKPQDMKDSGVAVCGYGIRCRPDGSQSSQRPADASQDLLHKCDGQAGTSRFRSPDRRTAVAGLIDGSLNYPRGLEMKALQQFRQGIWKGKSEKTLFYYRGRTLWAESL